MTRKTELSFAPAVPAMRAALEPHATWLEQILGCPASRALTLELEVPFGAWTIWAFPRFAASMSGVQPR